MLDDVRRGPARSLEALAIARQIADALEAAHGPESSIAISSPPTSRSARRTARCSTSVSQRRSTAEPDRRRWSTSPTMTAAGTRPGDSRHPRLYEPGAGPRTDGGQAHRYVGVRLRALRDADGLYNVSRPTATDTIAAVVGVEPDWTALPAHTPASIRRVLTRCLQKDARRRLHDVADVRIELEDAMAAPELLPCRPGAGPWIRPASWPCRIRARSSPRRRLGGARLVRRHASRRRMPASCG